MKYKNENTFKAAVIKMFRDYGWFCSKIESHTTGLGLPDVFMHRENHDVWVEFKVEHKNKEDVKQVAWRPGQLAWHYSYFSHGYYKGSSKCSWTFVGCDNGIICIPMVKQICLNKNMIDDKVKGFIYYLDRLDIHRLIDLVTKENTWEYPAQSNAN